MKTTPWQIGFSTAVRRRLTLSEYWNIASKDARTLKFHLDGVIWDPVSRELVVRYESNRNGTKTRACEIMRFDESDRQVSGEALFGAPV